MPHPPDPRVEGHVVVLRRAGCHLCDDAEAVIAQLLADHPALIPGGPVRVDVDADPQLRSRWGDHVPVTFVDGVLIAYWHLDRDTLLRALTEGPRQVAVVP
ncbi:glutaredoxin family protein [Acidipropionibacterium jensenii]|uniref:Glutaredoxin family protein n=1 Tax=Acidipropionibacterium jensenii TaxID=1749 RepID=A0A3Q9UM71_9ACTN|nr:glutaredoxin family protein [Acidipropionibacterium jensenii]AZZ43176.1 glutaredoxin family protein [Acidipropionibacterium jensenii]QCV89353.1 glutaredoxin family protein [Acidipropionibacterium jensenii]